MICRRESAAQSLQRRRCPFAEGIFGIPAESPVQWIVGRDSDIMARKISRNAPDVRAGREVTMFAFKELSEILKKTVDWERKLKDFYDVAEYALKTRESRNTVTMLKDRLAEKLHILEGVDPAKHGNVEWVRYAPAYKEEELIPIGNITRNSAPEEICSQLLDYESKLRSVYRSIAENLINRTQKELFESLVLFKDEQIAEIRRCAEIHRPDR
jgi:ferritin